MINNMDWAELEYNNYLAEQEMLDQLALLSIKSHGILTESALESINEAAIDTVMNYIKKVIANVQVTWNKFKATVAKGEYNIVKEKYGKYFDSNTVMVIENPTLLKLAEVDKYLQVEMPPLSENILDDLNGTPAEFIEKHLKSVYLPDKSISDVMNETTFKQSNNNVRLRVSSQSLKFYTTFMENYSKKVEKAGGDIDNINDASNKAKQIVEKMVAANNTTQQQSSQTSQSNGTKEQPKANNESFNLADTLLYYFTEEEKPKTTYRSANEPTAQSDNKDGGKEKKPDISKQITNYYKIAIQLLSAKLNLLNKSRKISMDIIKNFGKTAAGESGDNEKKTDNVQSTENKSVDTSTPTIQK